MRKIIYAYRLTTDSGYAPCVDNGILSLVGCKGGQIRKGNKAVYTGLRHTIGKNHKETLDKEDVFLFGIYKNKLLYFAKINEIPLMEEYFSKNSKYRGRKDQSANRYTDKDDRIRNEHGKYVLISKNFIYFGESCKECEIDEELVKILPNGRENKCYGTKNDDDISQRLYDFAEDMGFDKEKAIVCGSPHHRHKEHHEGKISKKGCSICG